MHGKLAPRRWQGAWGGPSYTSSGGDEDQVIDHPAEFLSLVLRPCADQEPRTIYLDSLSFYREELGPVSVPTRSVPLPFPTTPDTILPVCSTPQSNSVTARADGAYVFDCRGEDGHLRYVYRPETGTLSDLEVVWNDAFRFQPCAGGGVRIDVGGVEVPQAEARSGAEKLSEKLKEKFSL